MYEFIIAGKMISLHQRNRKFQQPFPYTSSLWHWLQAPRGWAFACTRWRCKECPGLSRQSSNCSLSLWRWSPEPRSWRLKERKDESDLETESKTLPWRVTGWAELTIKRIDFESVRGGCSVRGPSEAEGVVANVVGVQVRHVQIH